MKTAIFVMSDPKSGEESVGRVFNALAFAVEAQGKGDEVHVVFAGAGTRWPAELTKLAHPAHGLYEAARETIQGASCGCAKVFEATAGVDSCGLPQLKDHALKGTPGIASIRRYVADGWSTLIF